MMEGETTGTAQTHAPGDEEDNRSALHASEAQVEHRRNVVLHKVSHVHDHIQLLKSPY